MFVGIDLAADPRRTGLARLRDVAGRIVVTGAGCGAGDDDLIEAFAHAALVGVDIPLGWPDPFVELIRRHATGSVVTPDSTGPDWRRDLAMRATDRAVHRRTGLTPLSVSTDRIAHPALRWAGIEARLRDDGVDVARDGSGALCEVYPAAALRCWSLPFRGYKGAAGAGRRADLVAALEARWPDLDLEGHREACIADDNTLDAVIAALVAREVHAGRCTPPPDAQRDRARREGWIWLPTVDPEASTSGVGIGADA